MKDSENIRGIVLWSMALLIVSSCAPEPAYRCDGDYGTVTNKYKPAFETMEESCEVAMEDAA